ncbi:MAG: PqqD family protein [Brevundimonas sp.]
MEQAETIGAAARALVDDYDAPLEEIERDIARLAADLRSHGLLHIGA